MTNGEKDERWGSVRRGLKPDVLQNANAALKRRSFTLGREFCWTTGDIRNVYEQIPHDGAVRDDKW